MNKTLILLVLLGSLRLASQTTLTIQPFHRDHNFILCSKKNIMEMYSISDPDNFFGKKEVIVGDTTILIFENEGFKRKMTFKDRNSCDFDELIFKDSISAANYVKQETEIDRNKFGWKKIRSNYYLSKRKSRLEITIIDNRVIYRVDDIPSKERKRLMKQNNGT